MSVAATHTELSAHPSKLGVTSAQSGAELEADVARKTKLWGVINAFSTGRLPTNKQIDEALAYAQSTSPVDIRKLSPEGRVLIDDTRDLLETLRIIVAEKNADELIQNAVWSSYAGDPTRAKQDGVIPISKAEATKDADQAGSHLRVLATLFVTNSEFRKILQDLGFIGRDLFATTAQKAAEAAGKAADKARPTQEQLDQVDQEAPSKQWVGAGGQVHGPNETPHIEVKGPGGRTVTYDPRGKAGDALVTDADGNVRPASEVYAEAQARKAEAKEQSAAAKAQAKEQGAAHLNDINAARDPNASLKEQKAQVVGAAQEKGQRAQSHAQGTSGIESQEEAEQVARNRGRELYERIPEEHRARATELFNDGRQTLNEAFPEERREQFIYRLKKVVVEVQEHRDYSDAVTWFLETFENYSGHAKHVGSKGGDAAAQFKSDPGISQATNQFRTVLERFANGKSLNGITSAIDKIYSDAQQDPELRSWFTRLNDYVHRALLEPGYILEPESDAEARQLVDSGKSFFSERYRDDQKALADQVELFFTAFGADPLNVRLGDDVKRLTKDLLFNAEGDLSYKPELWSDLRTYFLPSLIQNIGYIPIPRAEYSDDKIDLAIENLTLSGPNLFPNIAEIESHNLFRFSPYPRIDKQLSPGRHVFRIRLEQIQADIRNVAFAFRRKSGWPRLRDSGIADVVLSGNGISVDVEIETVPRSRSRVYKTNHVKVKLDVLKFSIRNSKHDLLYKFIKTVATGVIKRAVQVAIASAIKNALNEGHEQLLQVRNTADDAKRSGNTSRQQAIKDLYAKKKSEKEAKSTSSKESKGEFKIVTSRDDVINPDLIPNSNSAKQFHTEDLAHTGIQGKPWSSHAFDLFDKNHPANTGVAHPNAISGAGAKGHDSSAVNAARTAAASGTGAAVGGATGLAAGAQSAGTRVVGTVPVVTEVPVVEQVGKGASNLTQGATGAVGSTTQGATGLVGNTVNTAGTGLTSGVNTAGQGLTSGVNTVGTTGQGLVNQATTTGQGVVNTGKTGVQNVAGKF